MPSLSFPNLHLSSVEPHCDRLAFRRRIPRSDSDNSISIQIFRRPPPVQFNNGCSPETPKPFLRTSVQFLPRTESKLHLTSIRIKFRSGKTALLSAATEPD